LTVLIDAIMAFGIRERRHLPPLSSRRRILDSFPFATYVYDAGWFAVRSRRTGDGDAASFALLSTMAHGVVA
jgi:hypothetical protein